jgi:hypothetical protein
MDLMRLVLLDVGIGSAVKFYTLYYMLPEASTLRELGAMRLNSDLWRSCGYGSLGMPL